MNPGMSLFAATDYRIRNNPLNAKGLEDQVKADLLGNKIAANLPVIFEKLGYNPTAQQVDDFAAKLGNDIRESCVGTSHSGRHIAYELQNSIGSHLPELATSGLSGSQIYHFIDSVFSAFFDHIPDQRITLNIDKVGFDNAAIVAALWCYLKKPRFQIKDSPGLDVHEHVALAAYVGGDCKAALRKQIADIDLAYPGAGFSEAFESVVFDPNSHPVGLTTVGALKKNGGVKRLDSHGVDLNMLFSRALESSAEGTMRGLFKQFAFLDEISEYQTVNGQLLPGVVSFRKSQMIKKAMNMLGDKNPEKHKGWEEMLTNLAPYTPNDLTATQYIRLAKLTEIPAVKHFQIPLTEIFKRGDFRKAINDVVQNKDIQGQIIYRLGVQGFYSGSEYHERYGFRHALIESIEVLSASAANQSEEFQLAAEKCRIILDNARGLASDILCKKALAMLAPFATVELSANTFILMADATIENPPKWPEGLNQSIHKGRFKSALKYACEPNLRQQIVMSLGVKDFFTRSEMLSMGSSRITDDLGL